MSSAQKHNGQFEKHNWLKYKRETIKQKHTKQVPQAMVGDPTVYMNVIKWAKLKMEGTKV